MKTFKTYFGATLNRHLTHWLLGRSTCCVLTVILRTFERQTLQKTFNYMQNDLLLLSFAVKGPAAEARDAPQPWGLLCNPMMNISFFIVFPCNGAPVEWNLQGKTEVLGGKTCPSATLSTKNPTRNEPGFNSSFRGVSPANNRLSHGTAKVVACFKSKLLGSDIKPTKPYVCICASDNSLRTQTHCGKLQRLYGCFTGGGGLRGGVKTTVTEIVSFLFAIRPGIVLF
jgi:hypothetical protein